MGAGASAGVGALLGAASQADVSEVLAALGPEEQGKIARALQRVAAEEQQGGADGIGPSSKTVCVRLPGHLAAGGRVELSPFDRMNLGRPVPVLWYYEEALDVGALLSALEGTLAAYPVLCGRYNSSPPTAVELNNAGVPVEVRTHSEDPGLPISDVVGHLPTAPSRAGPSIFARAAHERFLPAKEPMDPDLGSPDAPLLSVRITRFPAGGTSVGLLLQHGVCDADAIFAFARNWSRVFRGLELERFPDHHRCAVRQLSAGSLVVGDRTYPRVNVIPPGEEHVPEFRGVMPKIMGDQACVVPFPRQVLQELWASVSPALPAGSRVSVDDVLTALVWRALCTVRCAQVGVASDSEETTTVMRACNIRGRTDPPLGAGYCGNGATQLWTELPVRALLAMPLPEVSLRLRASLEEFAPEAIAAFAQWVAHKQQAEQCKVKYSFDKHALTFIISSWNFDWEGVDFNARPCGFDHGALVPIVANFTRRGGGDGFNVWTSGPREALDRFVGLLAEAKRA